MPMSDSKADRPLQLESSSRHSLPSLFFNYIDRINTKCYRNVLNLKIKTFFIFPYYQHCNIAHQGYNCTFSIPSHKISIIVSVNRYNKVIPLCKSAR